MTIFREVTCPMANTFKIPTTYSGIRTMWKMFDFWPCWQAWITTQPIHFIALVYPRSIVTVERTLIQIENSCIWCIRLVSEGEVQLVKEEVEMNKKVFDFCCNQKIPPVLGLSLEVADWWWLKVYIIFTLLELKISIIFTYFL